MLLNWVLFKRELIKEVRIKGVLIEGELIEIKLSIRELIRGKLTFEVSTTLSLELFAPSPDRVEDETHAHSAP